MVSELRKQVPPGVKYSEMLLPPIVLKKENMSVVPLLFHPTKAVFVGKMSNEMRRAPSESDLKMLYENQLISFEKQSLDIETKMNNHPFVQARRDPAFVHLIASALAQFKAIEFYIYDENGSFLLRDKLGEETVLIVKYDEDLDRDEATLREAGLSSELCDKLKARELMVGSLKHQALPPIECLGMTLGKPVVVDGVRRYYSSVAKRIRKQDIQ